MRKSFIFAAFICLLASCENPLEYRPKDASEKLIMNALLETGDTLHRVHLAISATTRVLPVTEARVKCYVNGVSVAEASQLQDGVLSFKADVAPGDKVRLEADADGHFHAWAEAFAPPAPALEKVDTSTHDHKMPGNDDLEPCLRVDVSLNDDGGRNDCYALGVFSYYGPVPLRCNLDTDSDVLLGDAHVTAGSDSDGGSAFEMGAKNIYGVFIDSSFNGRRVTVRPFVARTDVDAADSVKVVLSSISQRHYYYLKALNMLAEGSEDIALEDVSIPDNVHGGIGFVGISTPSTVCIKKE